jgi:adenine phosphoribosyltransferase
MHARLVRGFAWRQESRGDGWAADISGWWRDPELLALLGNALADPFRAEQPTVVVGIESSGFLLGPLAATALGVGFVAIRKDHDQLNDSDEWLHRTTPPDYGDRHQRLGVQGLVEDAHARWLGATVVVDALTENSVRRRLGVRALLHRTRARVRVQTRRTTRSARTLVEAISSALR